MPKKVMQLRVLHGMSGSVTMSPFCHAMSHLKKNTVCFVRQQATLDDNDVLIIKNIECVSNCIRSHSFSYFATQDLNYKHNDFDMPATKMLTLL